MQALPLPPARSRGFRRRRASVLVTALLLAVALGLGIVGYLALSRNALKLAQRTLFLNDASNLAEAGLEEALYCFNQMNSGVALARAWTGWTLTAGNARRTLPPFNRDQNGVAIVKVYVRSYDGSDPDPWVISQATITPFDGGPPVVKVLQINLGKNAYFANGLVGIRGLSMRGDGLADSYNSNPNNRPRGPWSRYSPRESRGNTSVAVASGTLSATSRNRIKGDLYLGTGVTAPSIRVEGAIHPDFNGVFPLPEYPSDGTTVTFNRKRGRGWRSSGRTTGKNRGLASELPRRGDVPAADGWYYYFCDRTTIADVTIAANAKVVIVGTNTDMDSGLVVKSGASCRIYIDGRIDLTDRGRGNAAPIDSGDWAGALQIFTSTARDCTIDTTRPMYACLYAPNARVTFRGDEDLPTTIVGSFVAGSVRAEDHINFIYDEALNALHAGKIWSLSGWSEMRTSSEHSELADLTDNFLP
jgi:hypothetical protein